MGGTLARMGTMRTALIIRLEYLNGKGQLEDPGLSGIIIFE